MDLSFRVTLDGLSVRYSVTMVTDSQSTNSGFMVFQYTVSNSILSYIWPLSRPRRSEREPRYVVDIVTFHDLYKNVHIIISIQHFWWSILFDILLYCIRHLYIFFFDRHTCMCMILLVHVQCISLSCLYILVLCISW